MRKILVVLVAVAIALGCWFYYASKRKAIASEETVSAAGVKKDLLSFAHAERAYKATHGAYASEDQLYASREMKAENPPPEGYTYAWMNSSARFSVIARCQIQSSVPCPSFSIDQNMELEQLSEPPAVAQPDQSYMGQLRARLRSLLAKFQ